MNIKQFAAFNFILLLCLFSVSTAFGQKPSDAKDKKSQTNETKNRKRIFVDVADKVVKGKLEEFFKKESRFEVVPNLENAELVFTAFIKAELKPALGTIERRNELPILRSGERSSSIEVRNSRQLSQNDYELWKRAAAFVYFKKPNGERVTLWEDRILTVNESKEPGRYPAFFQKKNEELYLAKRFVKEVEAVK